MQERYRKINRRGCLIGAVLVAVGVCLLVAKALSPEYIDGDGILHEAFFLLPLSAASTVAGLGTLLGTLVRSSILKRRGKR